MLCRQMTTRVAILSHLDAGHAEDFHNSRGRIPPVDENLDYTLRNAGLALAECSLVDWNSSHVAA